jgi:dTDP-4-amino-4,6-dideoxygalactose transaminase
MTPVSAAIGLGQLENVGYFLGERKRVAELLRSATEGFRSFTPQNPHVLHSYYTFAGKFEPDLVGGTSWQEFYDKFTLAGGDGFYSNCMNPYLEPSLRGHSLGWQKFEPDLCPTAEALQGQIMAFKTNYLDFEKAEENARILNQTLNAVEGLN